MSDAAEKPRAQIGPSDSDEDIELLILAAAGAIQRLFAERRELRSRPAAQEGELTRLRSQVGLIQDSYRRLTTEFVTQFHLIDSAVDNFVQAPSEQEDTSLPEKERASDEKSADG